MHHQKKGGPRNRTWQWGHAHTTVASVEGADGGQACVTLLYWDGMKVSIPDVAAKGKVADHL